MTHPPLPSNPPPTANADAAEKIGTHYDTRLPDLPWSRRIQIPIIAALVYSVIRILGPTLRFEVLGWHHNEKVFASGRRCIWAFWHRVIVPVVWWRRNHRVVVMNTTAFDGQWTRKVIEWLGYGTAQGSSSRGCQRGITFQKTWDHFLLPHLFSKTVMIFAPPIEVPPDADSAVLESKHTEMQRELERVRDLAESWFALTD